MCPRTHRADEKVQLFQMCGVSNFSSLRTMWSSLTMIYSPGLYMPAAYGTNFTPIFRWCNEIKWHGHSHTGMAALTRTLGRAPCFFALNMGVPFSFILCYCSMAVRLARLTIPSYVPKPTVQFNFSVLQRLNFHGKLLLEKYGLHMFVPESRSCCFSPQLWSLHFYFFFKSWLRKTK